MGLVWSELHRWSTISIRQCRGIFKGMPETGKHLCACASAGVGSGAAPQQAYVAVAANSRLLLFFFAR